MATTLVLGGARSGKSAHAEGLLAPDRPAVYVATARRIDGDTDWSARIDAHITRRPAHWRTVEAPDTAAVVAALTGDLPILIDDLATWLTGTLDDAGAWDGGAAELAVARADRTTLLAAITACPAPVTMVSAEVGLGVVPATRSGRLFRDELGALNALVAELCTDVLLLVAGIPVRLR